MDELGRLCVEWRKFISTELRLTPCTLLLAHLQCLPIFLVLFSLFSPCRFFLFPINDSKRQPLFDSGTTPSSGSSSLYSISVSISGDSLYRALSRPCSFADRASVLPCRYQFYSNDFSLLRKCQLPTATLLPRLSFSNIVTRSSSSCDKLLVNLHCEKELERFARRRST